MTKTETILDLLETVLKQADLEIGVFRERIGSFSIEEMPCINIKPDGDESETLGKCLKKHSFDIAIDMHVAGDQPGSEADRHVEQLHQVIMDNESLKQQVAHIEYLRRDWDHDGGDEDRLKLTIVYRVTYSQLAYKL